MLSKAPVGTKRKLYRLCLYNFPWKIVCRDPVSGRAAVPPPLILIPQMSDRKGLFEEYEEDGEDEACEGGEVVPLECLSFEEHGDYHTEHCETDNLLNDFELHKGERASVDVGANSVCRDLKAVFEEGYSPGEQDYKNHWPSVGNVHFLQF